MTTSELLRPSKHGDGLPRGLVLAPFAELELQRSAGSLHIEYESWMDSRRALERLLGSVDILSF